MSREQFNDFLKANYQLVAEKDYDCYVRVRHRLKDTKMLLRIYKANCLDTLPEELVSHIKETEADRFYYLPSFRQDFNNADFGWWDAVYGIRFVHEGKRWIKEVYVSSIVRRPFTEEQRIYYETHCFGLSFPSRVKVMYDSSTCPIP